MGKIPIKFNTSTIELVYKKNEFKLSYEDFIKALVAEEKRIKKEKDVIEKEEASKIYTENIYPVLDEGEYVKDFIEEITDSYDYQDIFRDGEEFPDEGIEIIDYFVIGEKIYEVEVFCDAEWVGDWSMRCNVPGEITIKKITEVVKYDVIEKGDGFMKFKLK